MAVLERATTQLDELFLLVIVGEFNSGKTAFVNALLGERFLTEGVHRRPRPSSSATARRPPRRPAAAYGPGDNEIVVVTYPVDWLREINIVDTPGTNAVIRKHEQITTEFVPRADLILFVTSADRPFTEQSAKFIEKIGTGARRSSSWSTRSTSTRRPTWHTCSSSCTRTPRPCSAASRSSSA